MRPLLDLLDLLWPRHCLACGVLDAGRRSRPVPAAAEVARPAAVAPGGWRAEVPRPAAAPGSVRALGGRSAAGTLPALPWPPGRDRSAGELRHLRPAARPGREPAALRPLPRRSAGVRAPHRPLALREPAQGGRAGVQVRPARLPRRPLRPGSRPGPRRPAARRGRLAAARPLRPACRCPGRAAWRAASTRRSSSPAPLAREFDRPCPRALARSLFTPHQTGRKRAERARGAPFRVPNPGAVAGRSILLVDDVLTTGATVRGASAALRRAGARRVEVAVLGWTPLEVPTRER